MKSLHNVHLICKWLRGIGKLVTRHFRVTKHGDLFGDAWRSCWRIGRPL